jgi:hypothetical protein
MNEILMEWRTTADIKNTWFKVSASTAFLTARKLVAVASHHPTMKVSVQRFIHFDVSMRYA